MSHSSLYVGLDYHQDSVQVCVMDQAGNVIRNCKSENRASAVVASVGQQHARVHAAVEACCGSSDLAEELASRVGWCIDLAHPGYVARMKQHPDKTDFTDARLLADLVRVGYLPKVWLAPESIRELRRLTRYRQQLVNERRNIKLRVGALLREQRIKGPKIGRWTKLWTNWLKHCPELSEQGRWIIDRHLDRLQQLGLDIQLVEQRLQAVTAVDPMTQRLLALPGIGLATACVLRAEIGRFDRFRNGKQLARFCGLSPRNASSGVRQADAGLIKAANANLRVAVIEASHRLMRYDVRWQELAIRMRAAGKPTSIIAPAIGNRWMRWLFHQMVPYSQAA
jgi:transposase